VDEATLDEPADDQVEARDIADVWPQARQPDLTRLASHRFDVPDGDVVADRFRARPRSRTVAV
jgi:hypothetical protein